MKTIGRIVVAGLLAFTAMDASAGVTQGNEPNATTAQDSTDGCSCWVKGMPVYSFKLLLAGLNISDTPVGYTPSLGPGVYTTVTYNQREANQPAVFNTFNAGQKWTLNWLSWIQDDPTSPGTQVLRYVAGGGGWDYSGYNPATEAFAPEPDNGAVLVMTSGTPSPMSCVSPMVARTFFLPPMGRLVFLARFYSPRSSMRRAMRLR